MKAFPKDVTIQTMTTRHIGVESELRIKRAGDECTCCCEDCCDCSDGDITDVQEKCSKRGLLQSVGWDGGGREFRTNPISVRSLKQVRGFKYFVEYYGILGENTVVIQSGGTHIHISILNTDHPNLEANATAMAIAFYRQFQKISGRETNWARRMNKDTLSEVQTFLSRRKNGSQRTYVLKGSMLNPTRHQTFEFRGPKGSNDSQEILAWVEFLENVVKVCNRESIEGIKFKRLLRGKRISAYVESLEDWRELTPQDLEQKFNGSKLEEA